MPQKKKPRASARSRSRSRSSFRLPGMRRLVVLAFAALVAALQGGGWDFLSDWLDLEGFGVTAPALKPTGQQVQTRFANCPQFFAPGGMPAVPSAPRLRELCFDSFAVLHSGQTRTPLIVAERLNRRMLQQGQGLARSDRFYADARVPSFERAELDDYRGSGYSRGHLAPAGDMPTPAAMAQSFSLANMVPQDQTHNAGPWASIEADTRAYALRAAGDVFVITGAVFGQGRQRLIGGRVAVPTHLFKLVYDPQRKRAWAHWQANAADTQVGRPISYAELVKRTNMELLPALHKAVQ